MSEATSQTGRPPASAYEKTTSANAPRGHPAHPIRETIRGIVRSHDQTGSHLENQTRHGLFGGSFAGRFEGSVCFIVDLLGMGILKLSGRSGFIHPEDQAEVIAEVMAAPVEDNE